MKNYSIFTMLVMAIIVHCSAQQKNKIVGIGYSVWHDYFKGGGFYYHDKSRNPGNQFGPYPVDHWWGDPSVVGSLNDYTMMISDNPSTPNNTVIDNHADLLYDAGVDYIALDLTNGEQSKIWDGAKAVCLRYTQRLALGYYSPQIVFFVQKDAGVQKFYNEVYTNTATYNQNIFFEYEGKPLVHVTKQLNPIPTTGIYTNLNVVKMWGLLNSTDIENMWSYKQNVGSGTTQDFFEANDWPEEMSVCAATQKQVMLNDANPSEQAGRIGRYQTGYTGGTYWDQQWHFVNKTNPSFVFIWAWNEWISQNTGSSAQGRFTDIYGDAYSADIEPSDQAGNALYLSLIDKVAKYKRNVPNMILRDELNGKWYFKFYDEEVSGSNDHLKKNFTNTFSGHQAPITSRL
ncbi:glycoside hydrolase family 71/99 protein [Marinoscillum furvescens]|uniref:Glycosyl hydrolase family 99 n=1 Tax=Marinoscillum furvescens DSM 4134 TaxID=1122208 RepID=A0A3D9L451_MARFU|nr:hypothetical protein [Marinoscillum furvescens]RED98351.1 hypothetical protein C7460_11021 [Marinoscillum furvescens DSM 4134]